MVEHKRLVYIITFGFVLMSTVAFLTVIWPEPVAEMTFTAIKPGTEKPVLGKPCSYKGESDLETNGLQCYFYGSSVGDRQGVWIKPDEQLTKAISTDLFSTATQWQNYTNDKLKLAFPVPNSTQFKVVDPSAELNLDQVTVEYDSKAILSINRIQKNTAVSKDLLEQDKLSAAAITKQQIKLVNGEVTAEQLVLYPKTSLENPTIIWTVDTAQYTYHIKATLQSNSALRYIVDYMVLNMVISEPKTVETPTTSTTPQTSTPTKTTNNSINP